MPRTYCVALQTVHVQLIPRKVAMTWTDAERCTEMMSATTGALRRPGALSLLGNI